MQILLKSFKKLSICSYRTQGTSYLSMRTNGWFNVTRLGSVQLDHGMGIGGYFFLSLFANKGTS